MDEWDIIFRAARDIVRTSGSMPVGLARAKAFARVHRHLLDDELFWERVNEWELPVQNPVVRWAEEGLERLGMGEIWQFLLLDLGDCPEIFWLYRPGSQSVVSEEKLRSLLLTQALIGSSELQTCISPKAGDPYQLLFGEARETLTEHYLKELSDSPLSGRTHSEDDGYSAYNLYFLWLAYGSLALLEPLRNRAFCQRILAGRERLYLLSGYEELFTYLATVTPNGLRFEGDPLPLTPNPYSQDASNGQQLMLPLE